MGWVDAAAFLDRVAREEMEELDRLTAFREPVAQQPDSIEASWRRTATQRARQWAEPAVDKAAVEAARDRPHCVTRAATGPRLYGLP
jgi:hypothetical protein